MVRLTRGQAARVALAAQGLGRARPAVVGRRAAAGVLTRIGLFQVDSVNVLARAHEMPLFSRCGPYEAGTLDALTTSRNPLAHEAWAHMASLVDVTLEPALRFRQRAAAEEAWGSMRRIAAERPGLVDEVIARLAGGPATARQLSGVSWGSTRRTGAGTGRTPRPPSSGPGGAGGSPSPGGRRPSRRSTTSPSGCCPAQRAGCPTSTRRRPTSSWPSGRRTLSASSPWPTWPTTSGCVGHRWQPPCASSRPADECAGSRSTGRGRPRGG